MTRGVSSQAYVVLLIKLLEALETYVCMTCWGWGMGESGSMVSHEKGHFLYCYIDGFAILVFRSG